MKYAHYDPQTGDLKGFYADDIHTQIPEPNVPLTDDEWNALLGRELRYINGVWEDKIKDPPSYRELRMAEYPSFGDQLDSLFHAGVFPPEMAALIQAVKDKYPKS